MAPESNFTRKWNSDYGLVLIIITAFLRHHDTDDFHFRFYDACKIFKSLLAQPLWYTLKIYNLAGIYLLKVNKRKTRIRFKICSKLTIKTSERRHILSGRMEKPLHCLSLAWSVFSCIWDVNLRIQLEYMKIHTRKTPNFDIFPGVLIFQK